MEDGRLLYEVKRSYQQTRDLSPQHVSLAVPGSVYVPNVHTVESGA